FSGGVKLVESIAGRVHSCIEAEGDDGSVDIVINSFRNADDGNALLVKFLRNGKRSVAPDHDQRVETELAEVRDHRVGDVALDGLPALGEDGISERVCGVRGAQDGTAKMKDAGHAGGQKRPRLAV